MMNRRERKKEETKSSIIHCALELFRAKGFPETSMEEIAEKADISKGTLYNYFENKESILSAYVQSVIMSFGKEMESQLKEHRGIEAQLRLLLDFRHDFFGKDPELTAIYLSFRMQTLFNIPSANPFNHPHRSGLEKVILNMIAEAQKNGEVRKDIPTLVLARNFQLITVNYFISCQFVQEPAELEQLREQLIEVLLSGAKA